MSNEVFISIGTKGTDFPRELRRIEPPLVIGENRLRWANPGKVPQAVLAHGWVSKVTEPFEVYPLEQAIRENRVVHVPRITWTAEADGSRHEGEAFFRAPWQPGQQPMMVAVRSATWKPGCVGRSRREMRGIESVARFDWNRMSAVADLTPVILPSRANQPWTREDRLVALNVYFKLPPGRLNEGQALIRQVAEKLQRTARAVVLKILDFASLDPRTYLQGHPELQTPGHADREFWQEYNRDRAGVSLESEEAFCRLFEIPDAAHVEVTEDGVSSQPERALRAPAGETESVASVKIRRGQNFFRQVVLNNYDGRCGVTGMNVRELLIASHIIPWADHPEHRLDVCNGICLSRLHDGAFDAGLITFDDDLCLMLSTGLKQFLPQEWLDASFTAYEGKPLRLPEKAILPNPEFLAYHRAKVFLKAPANRS